MRYEIVNASVVESFWLNAPYDTFKDAMRDLDKGIEHNCKRCTIGKCETQDALQQHNAKRKLAGRLIGE